ncbi:hypothetical protein KCP73_06165 [Salmonella enterica subsp. enterica]|nr:hypothetical protein KCP73_06165 [Salmonella enterica subsp. enterica]
MFYACRFPLPQRVGYSATLPQNFWQRLCYNEGKVVAPAGFTGRRSARVYLPGWGGMCGVNVACHMTAFAGRYAEYS